jgi:hypothetical protein
MDIPETYNDIEINGRTFRLNKMDARTGSYMLFKLIKIITPMFKKIDMNKEEVNLNDLNLTEIADSLFDLPQKQFQFIQDSALKVVQEILPGGKPFILNKYGEFEALNVEFDIPLVMNLTVQSIIFNVKGFFSEDLLKSLIQKLNISQQN